MTIEDELKRKIVQEGFPLQRYCSFILQNNGWNVEEEYPVQWVSPPVRYISQKTIRTSGDIRAEYQYVAKGFGMRMCVSCKKQSSINWVFMRAMFRESEHFFPRLCAIQSPNEDYRNSWEYEYRFENKDWPELYSLCNIPTTLINRAENNEETDKILQTADNLHLQVSQTMDDDDVRPLSDILPINQIIYIPVIVTAAEVYVYDIDGKKFDVSDPNCVNVEKAPYLLYQHQLPISKQRRINNPHLGPQVIFDKLNIFVVHYKGFEKFLNIIRDQFALKTIGMPSN